MEFDCEQLAIDSDWSLTRTNACHIGVMNSEMGELRDNQLETNWKLNLVLGSSTFITTTIVGALLVIAVRKLWGNNKK